MTRFNAEKADEFLEAVRVGSSNEVAAAHAGLPVATVREWLRGGTPAKDRFRVDVEKARATLEVLAIGAIRRRVNDDQGAAQYIADKARNETEFERLRALTT
jgi:cell division protein FtsB